MSRIPTWNPWRELRARTHLVFGLVRLPNAVGGGVYWPYEDGTAAVMIDDSLSQLERKMVLGHELVHDEEGGGIDLDGAPVAMNVLLGRLERRVNDEAARRFVPSEDLAQLVASIVDDGRGVEAWEIAEAFEVTDDVARRACDLLRDCR